MRRGSLEDATQVEETGGNDSDEDENGTGDGTSERPSVARKKKIGFADSMTSMGSFVLGGTAARQNRDNTHAQTHPTASSHRNKGMVIMRGCLWKEPSEKMPSKSLGSRWRRRW